MRKILNEKPSVSKKSKKSKSKKQKFLSVYSQKICRFSYIHLHLIIIMKTHCECGICGHFTEDECISNECKCCINFHIRSGPKTNKK